MKKVFLLVFSLFMSVIPSLGFSEIDDIASIEAQTKGEYKKIDKDFYLKGIQVFDKLEFSDEDKSLAQEIYKDFEQDNYILALSKTDKLSDTDEKKIVKALIYAVLNMMNSAEDLIKDVENPVIDTYKGSLHRENMFEITPFWGILAQDLSDEYDLDYQKWGFNASKNINNGKAKLDYKLINYSNSNHFFEDCLSNYIRVNYNQRPNPNLEYSASLGGKFFQNSGNPLIIGDIWGKYHINDNIDIKAGFSREAVEQSYITAVGNFVDGEFMGRATTNKVFADVNFKLKKDYYASVRGVGGCVDGTNLPVNFGYSVYINIGKRLYNNPHNPYIQKIDADLTTYNLGYGKNLLSITGNNGTTVGGYFSPKYYNATAFNIRFEGQYKRLSYGLKGFLGEQISTDNNTMSPTFGVSPFIKIKINNRLYLKTTYTLSEFADIRCNLFTIGLILRI